MSFWSKIFGTGAKAAADAVVDTAKGVSDIVERWVPSDKAQHEMNMEAQQKASEATNAARSYDPRTTSTRAVGELFNVFIDGITRLIRPGVTILLIGGVFGWWRVETQTVDPVVLASFQSVMAFWFGMRALTRDIPSLIKMIVDIKRGTR